MNILAGSFKGRKIITRPDLDYRPTTGIVRKSLFEILGPLTDLVVLDLFAGTGILGFEAASRGAAQVVFVEIQQQAVKLLHANIRKFPETRFDVIRGDVSGYLHDCPVFDLILADPPYGKVDMARLIDSSRLKLGQSGKFILESSIRDKLPEGYSREKRFGETRITIWEPLT
ncbi:MAG: RsmD family RNA methyltransferase [Candidatus Neomarinimicrobiota bacterium]